MAVMNDEVGVDMLRGYLIHATTITRTSEVSFRCRFNRERRRTNREERAHLPYVVSART
jgi:hypothetical protein